LYTLSLGPSCVVHTLYQKVSLWTGFQQSQYRAMH